jgi:hypothetical protein
MNVRYMIIIHKTFSKKEIIKFMADCGIIIEEDFNKDELKEYLTKFFRNNIKIKSNKYGYTKKRELLAHLRNKNNEKELKPDEKKIVVKIARKIIHLAKNHYIFSFSEYNNFEEVKTDCISIYQYGYLSSVRKAIKYYNYLDLDHINYMNFDNCNVKKKEVNFKSKNGKFTINFN